MPINIVYEYPVSGRLRRFWGQIASFFGILLILAGLIAAIPLIVYIIAIAASLASGGSLTDLKEGFVLVTVSTLISFVIFFIGLRLVRGTRRLVLFLRRFGFGEATQALTFALATAVGKSWRVVTLDDAQIAPMGVRSGMRWVSVAVGVTAIVIISVSLFWVFGGGFDNLVGNTMKEQMGLQSNPVGGLVAAFFVGLIVGLFALALVLIPAAFFASVLFFSFGINISVRRAEHSKAAEIMTERKIEPTTSSILRRSRGIFSPRLTVVRVTSNIWQETVRHIAEQSSTIVIDISEPTENLLWEVEKLRPRFSSRWVIVGERDHLTNMTSAFTGLRSPVAQRLLYLLDGENVLAYSSGRSNRKRFARALRSKLNSLPPL